MRGHRPCSGSHLSLLHDVVQHRGLAVVILGRRGGVLSVRSRALPGQLHAGAVLRSQRAHRGDGLRGLGQDHDAGDVAALVDGDVAVAILIHGHAAHIGQLRHVRHAEGVDQVPVLVPLQERGGGGGAGVGLGPGKDVPGDRINKGGEHDLVLGQIGSRKLPDHHAVFVPLLQERGRACHGIVAEVHERNVEAVIRLVDCDGIGIAVLDGGTGEVKEDGARGCAVGIEAHKAIAHFAIGPDLAGGVLRDTGVIEHHTRLVAIGPDAGEAGAAERHHVCVKAAKGPGRAAERGRGLRVGVPGHAGLGHGDAAWAVLQCGGCRSGTGEVQALCGAQGRVLCANAGVDAGAVRGSGGLKGAVPLVIGARGVPRGVVKHPG